MELRHLRTFLAVYEAGGFRAAAEAEHLAQPAVSRQIQRLEAELGVALFERTPTGASPTAAGHAFYARIEPNVRDLLAAVDGSRLARRLEPLRIGYIAPALSGPVTALVAAVRCEEADAVVELTEATSSGVAEGLRSRALDVGFLIDDGAEPDLDVTPLVELRYHLAVSNRHPLARRRVVNLAELSEQTFITIASREPTHQRILEAVRQHAPAIRVQEAFGYQQVYGLLSAGLGVAAVPPLPADRQPADIRIIRTRPDLPAASLALAVRRRRRFAWSETVGTFGQQWRTSGRSGSPPATMPDLRSTAPSR